MYYYFFPFFATGQTSLALNSASYDIRVKQQFFELPDTSIERDLTCYFINGSNGIHGIVIDKTMKEIHVFDTVGLETKYRLFDSVCKEQTMQPIESYFIYGQDYAFHIADEKKPLSSKRDGDIVKLKFINPNNTSESPMPIAEEIYELEYDSKNKYYKRLMHLIRLQGDNGSGGEVQIDDLLISNFRPNCFSSQSYNHFRDSLLGQLNVKLFVRLRENKNNQILLRKGDSIPDFNVKDLVSGRMLTRLDIHDSTVLFFTFVGCMPCKIAGKKLDKFGSRVRIVAIDPVTGDRENILSHIRTEAWRFEYTTIDKSWSEKYGIYQFPTIILIDRNLRILKITHNVDDCFPGKK